MRKHSLSLGLVCVVLLLHMVVTLPGASYAVDFRLKTSKLFKPMPWPVDLNAEKTHEPGLPPKGLFFPLVVYLVGRPAHFVFGVYPPPYIEPPRPALEYIGYVVVDADYRLTFVNKTKRPLNLTDVVAYYNAKPQDGKVVLGNPPTEGIGSFGESPNPKGELWVPRWSWNFITRFIGALEQPHISYPCATVGVPPDDTFVPQINRGEDFPKNEKRGLRLFNTNYWIENSPHNGTVPLQGR